MNHKDLHSDYTLIHIPYAVNIFLRYNKKDTASRLIDILPTFLQSYTLHMKPSVPSSIQWVTLIAS